MKELRIGIEFGLALGAWEVGKTIENSCPEVSTGLKLMSGLLFVAAIAESSVRYYLHLRRRK